MFLTSVKTRGNFSPARKVLSTTAPDVDALHLRAHERAALARLHVLELEDPPHRAFELDVHPVLELVGGDDVGHGGEPYPNGHELLADASELLPAVVGDEHHVLDPDAAESRDVDARLAADEIARLERVRGLRAHASVPRAPRARCRGPGRARTARPSRPPRSRCAPRASASAPLTPGPIASSPRAAAARQTSYARASSSGSSPVAKVRVQSDA